MAAALLVLPNELLFQIFASLDTLSLLSSATVSRNLSRYANLALYRRVFYVGVGEDGEPSAHVGCGFGEERETHLMSIPSGTRIHHFPIFFNCIRDSDGLRKSVREVSFCWSNPPESAIGQMIECAVGWLSPTARFFHLSPPPGVGRPFLEYPIASMQIDCNQLSTIALSLENDDLPARVNPYAPKQCPSDLTRQLHLVCESPSLRRLWLEDFGLESKPSIPVPAWRGTSPITYLCVQMTRWDEASRIRWIGGHLKELVSWPTGLRVFHIFGGSLLGIAYQHLYGGMYLIESLWAQRRTLEAVVMEDPYWFNICDAAHYGYDLREFTRLRVLSICAESMASSTTLSRADCMNSTLAYLPPKLEVLQVQLADEQLMLWYEEDPPERTRAWLGRLAALKAKSLPNLHTVILWLEAHKEDLEDLPENPAHDATVVAAMTKAGIRFAVPAPTSHISPLRDVVHMGEIEWLN